MKKKPLVSCLCVTRNRVDLLKRSINCFLHQSYDNKELVITYEDDDTETSGFIESLTYPDIVKLKIKTSSKLPLGELRNLSIDKCNGTYFCQWDDDDWYKENRIQYQLETIEKSNRGCSILSNWLVNDRQRKKTYLSGSRPWEGSIFCEKSLIKNEVKYLSTEKGEDTSLVMHLIKNDHVVPTFYPTLYIYVYHGANVWNREHWSNIMSFGKELSVEFSNIVEDILENKYSHKEASKLLDQHFCSLVEDT